MSAHSRSRVTAFGPAIANLFEIELNVNFSYLVTASLQIRRSTILKHAILLFRRCLPIVKASSFLKLAQVMALPYI